ncbi:MAG: alanine racemase [Gammaproteobacteria bacterium]
MPRVTRATIDLSALRHNFSIAQQRAPQARQMAVIKANAYGHGMIAVAKALPAADGLAVACVDEAVQLRDAGISQPLLILEGFYDAQELALCRRHRLTPVVHQTEQLELLESEAGEPLPVWLKLDTGMHRLGFTAAQATSAWRRLSVCRSVAHEGLVLMTHFANADDRDDARTEQQHALFAQLQRQIASASAVPQASAANSAGLLGWPQTHADWVRPGIMLYGVSPFSQHSGGMHDLRPVMTLRSHLIAIGTHKKGETIGYGGSWTCPEDMPVGVVAIGYGDGYPRHARSGTPVLIRGQRAPLIGRVSMDMLTVDLRGLRDARLGDEVILWGEGLPVEAVAEHADTIAYDLLCGVNPRVAVDY